MSIKLPPGWSNASWEGHIEFRRVDNVVLRPDTDALADTGQAGHWVLRFRSHDTVEDVCRFEDVHVLRVVEEVDRRFPLSPWLLALTSPRSTGDRPTESPGLDSD